MKRTLESVNKIQLIVRTNGGSSSIDLGMDHMTQMERRSIFELVGKTSKGGTVGFGMEPNEDGSEYTLKFILRKPAEALNS